MADQTEFILKDNSPITMERFQEVFDQLMSRNWWYKERVFNLKQLGWTWGYSKKKRALGTASYTNMTGQGRIVISKPLLMINLEKNPQKFEDTIRHEIAHAIDYMANGKSGHGVRWQKIAVAVGAVPSTGTKVIVSAPVKWTGTCVNGHANGKHRLTKNGRKGACIKCCNRFNNGKYSEEYKFNWVKNF